MSDESLGHYEFYPPDRVWIKVERKVTKEQVEKLLGRAVEQGQDMPYLLLAVDITDLDGATPEARQASAEFIRKMPPRALALVGGNFAQRVITKLVLKAAQALDRTGGTRFEFVADNDAATKWLVSQGEEFRAKGKFR